MRALLIAGRVLLGAALAANGVEYLLDAAGRTPAPGAPWAAFGASVAGLMGALLLGAGIMLAAGIAPRRVPVVVAAGLVGYALLEFVPALVNDLHGSNAWTDGMIILALAGACFVLGSDATGSLGLRRAGQLLYASALIVFGIQHFLYVGYVASLIPYWMPGTARFWAYATGVAMIAAAQAILARIQPRLACTLLAVMFLVFAVAVHLPRAQAAPFAMEEWTNALTALAVAGGALILAGAQAVGRKGRR